MNVMASEARGQLTWINEPCNWSYTDQGGLIVDAQADSDFFQDPAGKHIRATAPFLSMPVSGDFEMTAQLTVDMKHQYDSGCLMVMVDERNWCKLCFEYDGKAATIVSVVTRDASSDDCNSMEVPVANPYLRIRKVEGCLSFFTPRRARMEADSIFRHGDGRRDSGRSCCAVTYGNRLHMPLFIGKHDPAGLDCTFLSLSLLTEIFYP